MSLQPPQHTHTHTHPQSSPLITLQLRLELIRANKQSHTVIRKAVCVHAFLCVQSQI